MRQLGICSSSCKLPVYLWQQIILRPFEYMSVSAIEKLRKVAEKYNEKPLDFYDHLLVARKNSTVSPIYRRCMEKGEAYDRSTDPYANACDYYKECAYASNRDVEEILDLNRNEIIEELEESANSFSENFFQELAKSFYPISQASTSKRLSIDADFVDEFLRNKGLNETKKKTTIMFARTNFLMFLRNDTLVNQRSRTKRFISESKDDIIRMRGVHSKSERTIRIDEVLWNKIEAFRPANENDLSTHDLARGIYLLILNSTLSIDEK